MTPAAEQWMEELGLPPATAGLPAPAVVSTVAAKLRGLQEVFTPLLIAACGLTSQERVITGPVVRGLSTREIADSQFIAETTVQDHLKSIFDKTGTRSRRHLVAMLLADRSGPGPESGGGVRLRP